MHTSRLRLMGRVLLVSAISASGASLANATLVTRLALDEQIREARAICAGRCDRIESRVLDGQLVPFVALSVRDVLMGPLARGPLGIEKPGGRIGSQAAWVSRSPEFPLNTPSVLFLDVNGRGGYVTAGMYAGHFDLSPGDDDAWRVCRHEAHDVDTTNTGART